MKKILGLDLGVGSIGWALIETEDDNTPQNILAMGSRIVPLSTDDANEFSTGNAISKNQKRTEKRTARKGYDRYQLRRAELTKELRKLGMLPDEKLIKLPVMDLWQLRADAATKGKKLSLPEIGRVLYHLNQKRGYKHAKADENGDSKQKQYVAAVNQRYATILSMGKTIGQYFADNLRASEVVKDNGKFYTYRTKEQVFPRKAYVAEFDQIMECQKVFYPDLLTDSVIDKIRNEIIYYQRGLKSCKHLVSLCEFEKREYKNKDGKVVFDGPKVAPRTSPLFQVCKIWESVNALTLRNKKGDTLYITQEQRQAMFDHLDNHDKLTLTDLYNILGISKKDGWWGGKAIGKGLQGNTTKMQLLNALKDFDDTNKLLRFDLRQVNSKLVDEDTGEILQEISPDFEKEPLYQLWHTIYSIQEKNELANALQKKFGITDEDTVNKLYALDFVKPGFGNKSAKFIRRILPYMQDGMMYSEACEYIGVLHSNSLTKAQNEAREQLDKLPQIQKNELRQPIVEKILNQMINVVNALIDKYGKFDEIRIELARELKQSREERAATDKNNNQRKRENEEIAKKIEEFGVRSSRNRIQKYRMWEESEHKCFYCNQPVNASEFMQGMDIEVEHIIPKSLLFDNSFSNKVCSCRKCNAEKNNMTAYDFMKSKPESEFQDYLTRIDTYFKNGKISKAKRENLLTPFDKIPTDFIERQLRQSQYIAKKSQEILKQICHNVWATSGNVTDFLRHSWGYDEILHNLNFERYKQVGLTEIQTFDHKGQTHEEERIKDWSKRIDHRHHAVDALVIAETRQGYIQRLNNLNTERDAMFADVEKQSKEWKEKHSLLEKWIMIQPHISVADATDKVSKILISFKAGKKSASTGKRYKYSHGKKTVMQTNIIVPRGALCEGTVYGSIKTIEKNKPVKYLFENPELIFKQYIKKLVVARISKYDGDKKKALASLKKEPIYLDANKTKVLEYGTCYKQEYVVKYSLQSLKAKDVPSIVDTHIRDIVKERLEQFGNKEKDAFKEPLYADKEHTIQIRSVRCFTGLSVVTPVKYNESKEPIGFVKPGNNHHIAIYSDAEGNKHELVVTFWHAVERKKYGVPVVITNPAEVWDSIMDKDLPQSFLENLPAADWKYEISLQQNEMFILGMSEDAYRDALSTKDYSTLNKYLYRLQKCATKNYCFRLHIETSVDDKYNGVKNEMLSKQIGKLKIIQSFDSLERQNPHKVSITLLGDLVDGKQ